MTYLILKYIVRARSEL